MFVLTTPTETPCVCVVLRFGTTMTGRDTMPLEWATQPPQMPPPNVACYLVRLSNPPCVCVCIFFKHAPRAVIVSLFVFSIPGGLGECIWPGPARSLAAKKAQDNAPHNKKHGLRVYCVVSRE